MKRGPTAIDLYQLPEGMTRGLFDVGRV
jgi:hypothetical protein